MRGVKPSRSRVVAEIRCSFDTIWQSRGGDARVYERVRVASELRVRTQEELAAAYTPGVAELCEEIADARIQARDVTMSGKLIAVVTDGTAVLGLGNIGPSAGLPVVEGKALLYRELAGVDAITIALRQGDTDQIIDTIDRISPSFAGIHLEDIAAPACFEIEKRLRERLDIPVYHDDQEGTAMVVLAGLLNAAKVVGKRLEEMTVVICGMGASGCATADLLLDAHIGKILPVDISGIVTPDGPRWNEHQRNLADRVNSRTPGSLQDALDGADAVIGLSVGNVLHLPDIRRMASQPIVFALANPVQEISPDEAHRAGAAVIATGASKYPNQVNNVLAFPGVFRGLIQHGIPSLTLQMEQAVAVAIASEIPDPVPNRIVPDIFDQRLVDKIGLALGQTAKAQ